MSVDRPPRHIAVVGSGAAGMRATLALNLAAAISQLGRRVALCDPDGALGRALGADASGEVTLPGRAAGGFVLVASAHDERAVGCELVVAHATLTPADDGATRAARLLLVPVDASPETLALLRDASAFARSAEPVPRVRAVLARTLPRGVDRWALVERIEEALPGALYGNTLPMTRRADHAATGVTREAPRIALLFGGGTRAARAYRALASEVLVDLE
jgi:hypothetical protein